MLRTALALFMIGGTSAWGQAQNDISRNVDEVDRAAAYYHYMLGHMYAEKASVSGGNHREYREKAIENFRAAIKADRQSPVTSDELSGIFQRRPLPPFSPFFVRPKRGATPLDPTSPTIDRSRQRP